ncbi:TPA: ATP-binding protein [Yersinia enterocolitica]|nr:ATP-binding protein [Yersinia enterocolitica]EKN4817742.1 ATP-binding protein [Yersinia enterocolitica]EKN4835037.1 ATP-binding protein [Yersinia enterocolitica]CNK67472.1 Histidine kinase-%2C DNA gyrase B-%2C and HSP90-like ATPase [Yersinia enterocolitica]HDL7338454.1 ATP-binding protein [Yersinia enterocolitica]
MNTEIRLPEEDDFRPSAARLVESLRDTGYSKEAAFADIIDNSIAANATHIVVELQYLCGEFRVVIADNGDGMSMESLKSAMRYGSPRRDNPKSLGKFGMGLKTASTAFCRRLVVLSRRDGHNVSRAWDLDRIIETDRWELESPDYNSYLDDFEELAHLAPEHGTMVIWENIDRLINDGNENQLRKQLETLGIELSLELSAIFSKFINSNEVIITMKIGDSPKYDLKGWDPLCADFNKDGDGARARLLKLKKVGVDFCNKELFFSVQGSIIPSQNDLTSEERELVRYNLDNQGLYIYREGRLIWHDGWPNRMYKKEGKITRLRVELNFNHELDDVFSIDFRKSRVIIPLEVRKKLQQLIAPWRNEVINNQSKSSISSVQRDHGPSDKAIGKHVDQTKNAEIKIDGDNVTIRNKNHTQPVAISGIRIYEDNTIRVHEEESLLCDDLWEPSCDDEGNTCVSLGKSHPYFRKMYNVCKDNVEAMKALDMLLWSLANAEYGEFSEKSKITLLGYRQEVSKTLRYLSLELPDSEEDE